jgi:hypothetical protein
MCERPPSLASWRLPITWGRLRLQRESFILPLREGESRRMRQGVAHTHHLELGLSNTLLREWSTKSWSDPDQQGCPA